MQLLKLTVLDGSFVVHRLPPSTTVPEAVLASSFFAISKTDDELSIVCSNNVPIPESKAEGGWSCIKVIGPLPFHLTGILAEISKILSEANISMFSISTYDTDYILVKSDNLNLAKERLVAAGHTFEPKAT